jgi:hypothetical protein
LVDETKDRAAALDGEIASLSKEIAEKQDALQRMYRERDKVSAILSTQRSNTAASTIKDYHMAQIAEAERRAAAQRALTAAMSAANVRPQVDATRRKPRYGGERKPVLVLPSAGIPAKS